MSVKGAYLRRQQGWRNQGRGHVWMDKITPCYCPRCEQPHGTIVDGELSFKIREREISPGNENLINSVVELLALEQSERLISYVGHS